MNGVTGRMGTNQHLLRSMAEIIKQGGVKLGGGEHRWEISFRRTRAAADVATAQPEAKEIRSS